jgi:hypothetical protein
LHIPTTPFPLSSSSVLLSKPSSWLNFILYQPHSASRVKYS